MTHTHAYNNCSPALCRGAGGAIDPPVTGNPLIAVMEVTSASEALGPNTCVDVLFVMHNC